MGLQTAFVQPAPLEIHLTRGRCSTCRVSSPKWTCSQRIILIPDRIRLKPPELPAWTRHLSNSLSADYATLDPIRTMPNPYDSNSKRWESVWISAIHDAIAGDDKVCLLGHASGADACLRYMEKNPIAGGLVLLQPTSDEYYAAERHGRAYYWQLIRDNVRNGRIALATSAKSAPPEENENIVTKLRPVSHVSLEYSLEDNTRLASDILHLIHQALPSN